MLTSKILITVKDGLVVDITTNTQHVEITVLDWDTEIHNDRTSFFPYYKSNGDKQFTNAEFMEFLKQKAKEARETKEKILNLNG